MGVHTVREDMVPTHTTLPSYAVALCQMDRPMNRQSCPVSHMPAGGYIRFKHGLRHGKTETPLHYTKVRLNIPTQY